MFKSSFFYPYLALLVAMFLWGSSFIALKIAVGSYHPILVIFFRMFIGTLVFLLFGSKIWPRNISWYHFKLLLFMGLLEPCLYFLFESFALTYTSAAQASLIVATLPLMVGILASFVLNEPFNLKMITGFLISLIGVGLLTKASVTTNLCPDPALGNFLEFLAMIVAAGYTVLVRKLSVNFHPLFLAFVQSLLGTIFFGVLGLFWLKDLEQINFQFKPVFAVIYLGVVVTFLAYSLYNYGLSKVEAGKAAMFTNFIPVFAVFLSWWILDETLNKIQLAGCILVGLGIWVSQKGDK